MKVRPLLPVAVAATAVVVAGCAAQTITGHTSLPALQLTDTGTPTHGVPAVDLAGGGGPSGFVLRATLPTTTPPAAPVWRLSAATADDAARVADALAAGARPTAVSGGWVARRGTRLLAVRRNGSWTWGLDCSPSVALGQENLDVMCASASVVTPGVPLHPSEAQVRALAVSTLQRLGWSATALDVVTGSPTSSVTARQRIAGIETADWTTMLSFDVDGALVDANGWVGTPTRGRSYPLIDAARAFAALQAEPRMTPELCRVRKDGKPGCEPFPPTVITGATLGLALRHDLGRPLLVPAWLFAVQGSAQPIAVVAVDPRWLKAPTGPATTPR
jgi:hypothetical protein